MSVNTDEPEEVKYKPLALGALWGYQEHSHVSLQPFSGLNNTLKPKKEARFILVKINSLKNDCNR